MNRPTITTKMMEAMKDGKSSDGSVEYSCYNLKACSPGNRGRWKSNGTWKVEGKRMSFAKCCEVTQ